MAEFKLGRIKFVYQGAWTTGTAYVVDDVITVGGKSYICVVSHTASALFSTDLNNNPPYWNIVSDGQRWTGNWANSTYYNLGDQVLYGGNVYFASTAHTSASATATLTATAASADGTTATITFANQVVQPYLVGASITVAGFTSQTGFNGTFTVTACTTSSVSYALAQTLTGTTMGTVAGPSQLGLENDLSKWTLFASNFNWSNAWSTNTRYKVRDLVTYGGYTYVCNAAHVSANTATLGLEANSGAWDTFNAGISYQSSWSGSSVRYKLNDVVKFGSDLWICTTNHTSTGTSPDLTKFSIFVNGLEFVNSWSSATAYVVGDLVTYGGYTYSAVQNSTNQTPSTASSYWQVFTTGFSFQGDYVSSTPYKIGSVVRQGGYTYLGTADSTIQTLTITGTTISTDPTRPNQITTSGNTNVLVTGLPITFGTSVGGLSTSATYYVATIVDSTHFTVSATSGGAAFTITSTTTGQSVTATTNPSPPFSGYWTKLNSGIRWNTTNASYTNVSGTNLTGTGSGATFDITTSGTAYTVTVHSGSAGSGYNVNNTIKILGTSVGGLSPANDITITVSGVTSTAIQTISYIGYSVTWGSGVTYVLGDAVYFGANTYICVSAHVATSGNRPDADSTGTYWNLLASGAESAVLTTQGDMFYYGANGPQRLPIGTDGQVLRVNSNTPSWQYYGQINNLVYVAPTGTDTLAYGQGTTIDKPWQTVRYACQQIENGYLNINAAALLAKNKQFVMKEINNYVKYTNTVTISAATTSSFTTTSTAGIYVGMPISFSTTVGGVTVGTTYYVIATNFSATAFSISTTYNGSIFTLTAATGANVGSYVYDQTRTERDTGIVLEAIIFDISHGGNLNTTNAALAYFTTAGSGYVSGVSAYDITAFVGALNYKATLLANILANTAPTNNYQTLNGVSSGNQAKQIIDTTLTAETGTTGTTASLISIVTVGLLGGNTTYIPPALQPNTTISVKTGSYSEVLPMVLPRNTAIVGDELRSTTIQPAQANAYLVNDKPRSINALTRIQSLVSNLMSNTPITGTAGNSQVIATTGASSAGGTSTITFAVQTSAPFTVGQSITVSGVTPTGFNGAKTVTACTTSSVSFAGSTAGPQTVAGIVSSQVTALPAGDTGSTTAVSSVIANAALMQQIISNGISQTPAFSFTNPTGYNTGYLVGFGDGKAQIVQNYAFIQGDVATFFANSSTTAGTSTVSAVWTALGSAGQAKFYTLVQNILDAIVYDMTYGTNIQSQIIGSSFYSYSVAQLTTNQISAYGTVFGFLKTEINNIVTKAAITPQSGNVLSQVTAGTTGSAAAGSFAQARVQNVVDWLNVGLADATSATFTGSISSTTLTVSSVTGTIKIGQVVTGGTVAAGTYITAGSGTSWTVSVSQTATATGSTMTITPIASGAYGLASSALQTAYTALIGKQAEIQSDTVVWVKKFYQSLAFNSSTCYRDAGYIVQALAYDLLLGSNGSSIFAARQYFNNTASAAVVTSGQLSAEVGSIGFIAYKAKVIASSGSVAQVTTTIDDINNLIYGTVLFNTVISATVSGTQAIAYSPSDILTVSGVGTTTYSVTLNSATTALTIINVTSGGVATFSSALTVVKGQSVVVPNASGGMSAGTYYVTTSATYTTQVTLSSSYSNAVAGTPTAFTGGVVSGATNVTLGSLYNTVASVTVVSGGNWTTTPTTAQATSPSVSSGSGVTLLQSYGFSTYTTTVTAATTSTNLITVGSTTGMAVNMPISFSGLPANITTTASAISSSSITLGATVSSLGIVVGQAVYFTGITFGGIVPNTIYYVKTASASAITISATLNGTALTLTNATGTMNVVVNAAGGLAAGNVYWINSIASSTTLTVTTSYKSGSAFAITNTVSGLTATTLAGYGAQINVTAPVGLLPHVNGTVTYNNTLTTIQGAEILRANITFLAYEASAYTNATYGGSVTTTTTGTNIYTTSGAHNLVVGDPIVFSGSIIANSGVTAGTVYWILTTPTTSSFTIGTTSNATIPVAISSSGSGSMTVNYYFNLAKCIRDTTNYINALVYDLTYTGNYKSLRAAQLYNNAVSGSTTQNMFLVRNGSGIRNITMSGLYGGLTTANSYGTKRPTAGSYASLDPGFGPNDSNVWINTRSCYTQNCTMFGYACVGAKIDAALHNGGNKSMVANDYTTVIGDGIGVWCTGSGSLTELVSVFNYYGYAGYLAELGGRIRATNGNSSYGTYGVIAEGTDTYETPISGTINNRAFSAYISNTVTDAVNQILRLEYQNAGTNYTNTVTGINGSGYNAFTTADEFRDSAVFESRLIDLNDGNGVGGTSYVSNANTSQGGAIGYITLAATDTLLSAAYVGMRIQLTAGSGVGQYANVLSYNNGSKNALVYKDSFATLTVTGSTTTVLQVASTSTLYVGMPIYLSATTAGIFTANTVYYIATIPSTTTFTLAATAITTPITGLTATSGQTISLYAAGWDHVVPGWYTATNALDLTTTYIIEPRISYTSPGYLQTARTIGSTSATWKAATWAAGYYVAVASGSTTTAFSSNGTTWTTGGALPSSQSWTDVVYGGGQGATATAILGGQGGTGATFSATIGTGTSATQIVSISVLTGGYGYTTPPTIVITGGGGTGATATCTVLNGAVQTVTVTVNGSGYTSQPTITAVTTEVSSITVNSWGQNYFSTPTVTISQPQALTPSAWAATTSVSLNAYLQTTAGRIYQVTGAGTTGSTAPTFDFMSATQTQTNGSATLTYIATQAQATALLTNNGVSGYNLTNNGYGYTSVPSITIVDSGARFVTISGASNNSAYQVASSLGSAWVGGSSTGKTNLASLAYGNGVYVAVGGASATASAVSSTDGATWVDRSSAITALSAGSYSAVTYGNGYFVAINTGGNITSVSANGVTWTAGGTLPSSTTWSSIAYGNGRFVAIASGGTSVAYSIDKGVTWKAAPAGLPSSQTWTKIVYGEGLFFAIASGTQSCATSPDGINWTAQSLSSSSNWTALAFGNPTATTTLGAQPLFVAISNSSGTIGCSVRTGATTLARMKSSSGVLTEIRLVEPGSGYPKGNVTATTVTTNVITVDDTTNLIANQPVVFNVSSGGLVANKVYYIIGSSIVTNTSFQVAATSGSVTPVTLTTSSPTGMIYRASPIATQTDPNKVITAPLNIRMGDGVLGNPSFSNRGTNNATATTSTAGDGFADIFQNTSYINVAGMFSQPSPGANIQFGSIPNSWYKLVAVTNLLGVAGNYTMQFQVNPALTTLLAPVHGDTVVTRLKYSQVRLTGHDFLYIGTGNQTLTNYPNVDPTKASQAAQSLATGGGRVFFTSTDQDGNFNVGNLFGVQQATGTATLNASAFNLAGLQSLQLGSVSIGVGSATITQFSTDPYFTANSDNTLPTQKAIKSYIAAQIGGGQSVLNVNTITSGQIYIANNTITTTSGSQILVTARMNFVGGIDGAPVALAFFGQR